MIKTRLFLFTLAITAIMNACMQSTTKEISTNNLSSALEADLWLDHSEERTIFRLWSPNADRVSLHLYKEGNGGEPMATYLLKKQQNGVWSIQLDSTLNGTYYTYQVTIDDELLEETPGIYAQAVGVNGQRAMVLEMSSTNPTDWEKDKGPPLASPNDAIIYEMHVRDLSIHPESGIENKGLFLGLAEPGTKTVNGSPTGLDHIVEMGVTHVHLLPSFDFASVDETKLDSPQYNWGYDPQNYNAPNGSFSTDPFHAEVRIREFKKMVKTFHDQGVGVILDVVYNHTGGDYQFSNFNREYPEYYYRHWEDGTPSDAAYCGNETASDKEMMRKYMIESVSYWAKEYHIDGFRFDLMAIHDIETMNELATVLKSINPNVIIYGEGWTASDSPLPVERRALKVHTKELTQLSAFSDDLRDGLKGSVFDEMNTGFVNGATGMEESVKFGIIGAIDHPQVDYSKVNYSDAPWSSAPWQAIAYVSCHDNHTLFDKLELSRPDASRAQLIAMDKLANAVVLTSQGISFIHAGSEMLRTKQGNHNSYNAPDSINWINWSWKSENEEVVEYYKNLIRLKKEHPAFRMRTKQEVQENLSFKTIEHGLISYQISNNATGDSWKNIYVIYNARNKVVDYKLPGTWKLAVRGDEFFSGKVVEGIINVPALSMLVAYQE